MYNPFSLLNKRILVTGASSGIGQAIAIECSKMGATVYILGRDNDRLQKTYTLLTGNGHLMIPADITNKLDVDLLFQSLPLLDGVVHCAGLIKNLPFKFISDDTLSHVMNVNFAAPALISARLVKEKKINKKGSIVFISSISGKYCASYSNSMYVASKSAIDGMMKGMALDLSPKEIRVNCINPGMIDTAIFNEGIITKEQLKEDEKKYPLKRYGKPEEVAYAAIYLLSDASQWVTGSNLLIDGGYTLL